MRRLWVALAALALLMVMAAAPALGRPGYVTILYRNAALSGLNNLELGWTLDKSTLHPIVDNSSSTSTPGSDARGRIVLTTTDAATFHIYFRDVSCVYTYFDDNTPIDHVSYTNATVKQGTASTYYFRDAGYYVDICPHKTSAIEGTAELWNGKITVIR